VGECNRYQLHTFTNSLPYFSSHTTNQANVSKKAASVYTSSSDLEITANSLHKSLITLHVTICQNKAYAGSTNAT